MKLNILRESTENRYTVIDIQTTDIRPESGEIMRVSALKVADKMPISRFDSLVRIAGYLPRNVAQASGITAEALQPAPSMDEVKTTLTAFVGGLPVVVFNKAYCGGFFEKYGLRFKIIDLLTLAKNTLDLERYKSTDVMNFLGIEPSECCTENASKIYEALKDAPYTLAAI